MQSCAGRLRSVSKIFVQLDTLQIWAWVSLLCTYQLYAPFPPSRAIVGQTRRLVNVKFPNPGANFPAPPPGLTERIGLSASRMKIAIIFTYSAD